MDTDHRVRLAHHLISTSIFKKLLCPFLGSLQLYQTEQAPSSVFHKFFGVPPPAATPFNQLQFQRVTDISCYPFRAPTSTPRTAGKSGLFQRPDNLLQIPEEKVSIFG